MANSFTRTPIFDRKCKGFGFDLRFVPKTRPDLAHCLAKAQHRPLLLHMQPEWDLDFIPACEETKQFALISVAPEGVDFIEYLRGLEAKRYEVALTESLFEVHSLHLKGLCKAVTVNPTGRMDFKLQQLGAHLKRFGVRVFGVEVESFQMFNKCVAFGFDYVQGPFYLKPVVEGQFAIPTSRTVLLNLMSKIHDPHTTIEELEAMVSQDPALIYKILRIVNSAAEGLDAPIETLRPAILYLGLNKIAALVSIMAVKQSTSKPKELIQASLMRAKLCELMAMKLGLESPDRFFTAGLFSLLDAVFDVSLEALVFQIPLSKQMADGLLNTNDASNPFGRVLGTVKLYEAGRFDEIEDQAVFDAARDTYYEALIWADEAMLAE